VSTAGKFCLPGLIGLFDRNSAIIIPFTHMISMFNAWRFMHSTAYLNIISIRVFISGYVQIHITWKLNFCSPWRQPLTYGWYKCGLNTKHNTYKQIPNI
jgi:hypothetical protein